VGFDPSCGGARKQIADAEAAYDTALATDGDVDAAEQHGARRSSAPCARARAGAVPAVAITPKLAALHVYTKNGRAMHATFAQGCASIPP
jgi:hypothetical protein